MFDSKDFMLNTISQKTVTKPEERTVMLHDFEQALENYTAAMIWASE
jgi:hypothetical protein